MERIQIDAAEPAAYQAMFALENYLQQGQLSNTHKDLVKIRASQLNGCAYCINMHTKEALKNGEDQRRIFLLDAWQESGQFTEEEKTILKIAEEVTMIHQKGLTDATYREAMEQFDENYLSQVIMTAVVINAWNRIAISTHKPLDR